MKRRSQSGFTLIELVVALALASIVSLLLLNGMRLATTGLDRLSRESERLDQRRGGEAALRQALGTAVPVGGGARGFAGAPNSLRFLTLVEDGTPGVYLVELALDDRDPDRPVVLTRRLAQPPGEARMQQSVLAWHARAFRLAYFGAAKPGDDPVWNDRWDSVAALPRLVRVTITPQDGQPEPPLTVRLWGAG